MSVFKNMVTCMYCTHFVFEYDELDHITPDSKGYCKIKRGETSLATDICVNFKINPAYHTSKWYPNSVILSE